MDIKKYLQEKKEIVDRALENYLPKQTEKKGDEDFPSSLRQAMRHSLFSGGKRIRPILSIAAYEAVGGMGDKIIPFACALELIHTYSLIHDDLPAIDNDDYRRGNPTCHKVFGEAMGILAGDGLLTEAFRLMTHSSTDDPGIVVHVIHEIAQASGISGMVGGQVADIESEGKAVKLPTLQYIHTHKTGALITVSVRTGARLGGGSVETISAFSRYGERIGHSFQIVDDILNVEGKPELLGKNTGGDLLKKKATYPALLGLEESKKTARALMDSAIAELRSFGPEVDPLREIAQYIVLREN